jgi:actin-related protein 6
MESERFSIPEILFHPNDIGIPQAGVVEALGDALKCLHDVSKATSSYICCVVYLFLFNRIVICE